MSLEENILNLIPQRPPFVMVDKLLDWSENHLRTSFSVKPDNIFVENNEFREPGLIENIAQSAAAGAGYAVRLNNKKVAVGYIGAIKNLEIFGLPKINDELFTEVNIENRVFDVTIISGVITCNNMILARCEMKIFINNESGE